MVQDRERLEIELPRLMKAMLKKAGLIILVGIFCAGLVGGITKFLIPVKYESTATMLVLTKETTLSSLADLQMGSQLTKDYALLINSKPVLKEVIDNLKLDMTHKELKKHVIVNYLDDSRVLTITVVQENAEMSKKVVDEMAKVSSEFIGEQMEAAPPKIIEVGEIPEEQSSPSLILNTALGLLIGVFFMCIYVCIKESMNDSVQSEEDIEKYVGGAVLAVVPYVGVVKKSKQTKNKKKVRRR